MSGGHLLRKNRPQTVIPSAANLFKFAVVMFQPHPGHTLPPHLFSFDFLIRFSFSSKLRIHLCSYKYQNFWKSTVSLTSSLSLKVSSQTGLRRLRKLAEQTSRAKEPEHRSSFSSVLFLIHIGLGISLRGLEIL